MVSLLVLYIIINCECIPNNAGLVILQIIICKVYSASGEGSIDPDPCLASPGAHAPVLADKPGGSHSRTRQRIVKYKQTTKIYSDFAKWQNRQSVTDL